MAQYEGSYPKRDITYTEGEASTSGWAIGFILFASAMMVMIGMFHSIAGLAAIFNDDFYVVRAGYDLKIDVTTWGWLHFIGGIVIALAGVFLFTGTLWARIVAILAAMLSMVYSFYSIPYYPVWSILIITLDIAVIWALLAHGRELSVE